MAVYQASSLSSEPAVPASRFRTIATIGLFTLLYMMMFVDRSIMNWLLESIKHDLQLSDTVLGLIAGFGFSLFHTILGFPAARWGDRGDRRIIITLATGLWAGMTMMCGLVQSGFQLALARIGVGIGEATSPILHSVLADNTSKDMRASALSILLLGSPLAALICFPLIGWIDSEYGWRVAFLVAGLPGLLTGAAVFFFFRDRVREAAKAEAAARGERLKGVPLGQTLRFLFAQRTFYLTALGYVISQVGIQGFVQWGPTLLRRLHSMGAAEVGASFGLSTGALGLIGGLIAAVVLPRTNRFGDHWKLIWPALATALVAPFILAATMTENSSITVLSQGLVAFMVAFKFGPIIAVNQNVVPGSMRSFASSIQGFAASILAIGGGPLWVGWLSDTLAPTYGIDGLRIALMSCAGFTLIGGLILFWASRYITADIVTAEQATA